MKKIIKFLKSNILGFLVGMLLCLNGVIIAENMLSSEQVSYSGTKTEQTTVKGTLDQLFDAVDINERLGSTDISSIGNGTITGAINDINSHEIEWNPTILKGEAVNIDSYKAYRSGNRIDITIFATIIAETNGSNGAISISLQKKANGVYSLNAWNTSNINQNAFYTNKDVGSMEIYDLQIGSTYRFIITGFYYTDEN